MPNISDSIDPRLRAALDAARAANPGIEPPRYDLIPKPEMDLCVALGTRAALMVEGLRRERRRFDLSPADPRQCACDFATVHLTVPLKLYQLLLLSDQDFFDEYATICRVLDRRLHIVKDSSMLRFAQSSAN